MQKLPNIVLIVMDAVRAKELSVYGAPFKTSPNLEKIARDSTVYTRCFSTSGWTVPSHASLFTGLYTFQHKVDGKNFYLPSNVKTLPEILSDLGYRNYMISSNHLISEYFGYGRGFDYIKEFEKTSKIGKENFIRKFGRRFNLLKKIYHKIRSHFSKSVFKNSTPYTIETIEIIKNIIKNQNRKKPFFIFTNIMQAHARYNPPSNFKGIFAPKKAYHHKIIKNEYQHYAKKPLSTEDFETLRGLYREELLFLDSKIYEIYEELEKQELLDDTIFIVTSDHGETLGEHGLYEHTFSLYNELLHIPLIIHYPREFKVKRVDTRLAQIHDIFGTIMELLGRPYPNSSISLLGKNERQIAISQRNDFHIWLEACKNLNPKFNINSFKYNSPEISLITKNFLKIIKRGATIEFYDLNNDYEEQTNLAYDSNEYKKEFEILINKLFEIEIMEKNRKSISKNEEIHRRLKLLGYL